MELFEHLPLLVTDFGQNILIEMSYSLLKYHVTLFVSLLLQERVNFLNSFSCFKRYFDHRPTIRRNAKKLNNLLLHRNNMT